MNTTSPTRRNERSIFARWFSGDELIRAVRTGSLCRDPQAPFEIEHGGHVANSNPGNGSLRPETFGETG